MDGRSTLNRVPLWIVVWWRTSLCINLFDIIVLFSVVNTIRGHLIFTFRRFEWSIAVDGHSHSDVKCSPVRMLSTGARNHRGQWWYQKGESSLSAIHEMKDYFLIVFHLPRMNRSRSSERSSSTTTTSHVKILGVSTDWMQMNVVGFLHHSNFLT